MGLHPTQEALCSPPIPKDKTWLVVPKRAALVAALLLVVNLGLNLATVPSAGCRAELRELATQLALLASKP